MTTSHPAPNRTNEPPTSEHVLPGRDDEVLRLRGRLLGFASSQSDDHHRHLGEFAQPGERCSACRWFEVRLLVAEAELVLEDLVAGEPNYRVEDPRARYLVITYGCSTVPGEETKRRAVWTDSAYDVIELLTQRGREDRRAFLPAPSARALAQAAQWDDDLNDAYLNRAVV